MRSKTQNDSPSSVQPAAGAHLRMPWDAMRLPSPLAQRPAAGQLVLMLNLRALHDLPDTHAGQRGTMTRSPQAFAKARIV